MVTPVIGTKGAHLDLLIRQGATLGPNYVLVKDSGTGNPVDITGAIVRSQIRKTSDDVVIQATGVCTITDAVNGQFTFTYEATATELLDADPTDENGADSLYVWDLEIEYLSGVIDPLMYGDVRVFREVTK